MAGGVNPYRAGTRAGTSGACAPPDRPGSAVAPAIAVPIAVVAVIAVAAVLAVAIIAIVAVAAVFVAAGPRDFPPGFPPRALLIPPGLCAPPIALALPPPPADP